VKETPQKAFGNDTPESHTADSAKLSWRNNASWKQFSIVGLPPKTIILLMVLSIFVGELIVMFILHLWPELPVFTEALINALILVLIISPTLVLFHYRPMVSNLRQRDSILGQLLLSEERLNLALQAVNDGLWDCNVQTGEIYFTPRFATMLGYSPDEIKPTFDSLKNLVHPEDRDLFDNAINECLHSPGKYLRVEVRLKCRTTNPEWLWVLIRGNVVERATDGSPLRAVGTNTNIHERKQAEAALHQSEQGIRSLSRQLINNSETEKKHLAHELHDDFGQTLAFIKIQIKNIQKKLLKHQNELKEECENSLKYADQLIEKVRSLSHGLTPLSLNHLGLTASLQSMIENFSKYSNLKIQKDIANIDRLFPPLAEITIYRIFQEIFTNIEKHANSDYVKVEVIKQNSSVSFKIEDNGKGFDIERIELNYLNEKRIGLASLKERVRMLGGRFKIQSQLNEGTKINFTVPFEK